MSHFVGIDAGSSATKGLLLAPPDRVAARSCITSGASFTDAADRAIRDLLQAAGVEPSQVERTVATGYGRSNVPGADDTRTEIACHARGVHHLVPGPHVVVDIGGQDNKVIRVGAQGQVVDFTLNRKCAAGTGAFLEEAARKLEIPLDRMDGLAREADEEIVIGSFCTVFASTEMLKLIREGKSIPSIVRGAFRSVVRRVVEMGRFDGAVVLSGGVAAHNPVIAEVLAAETGVPVTVCPEAQHAGALGAALIAAGC